MDTDDRIDYAERQCRASNLTSAQTAQVLAYLLGAILTHFDSTPVIPLTDTRWFRLVDSAIHDATT